MATTNTNFKVKNGLDAGGDITTTGVLKSTNSAANEGGQVELSLPSSGTTLSGTNVTIDVYQDKIRFFESGGTNRGAYIPLTSTGASVGTSLLGGTTGAMNYAQTIGTKQSAVSTVGTSIVSVSITTNGYPVQVTVTGDVENNSAGGWVVLQLYRGSTAIGNPIHAESSAGSENVPYAISVIDTPSAGTYTYAMKLNNAAGGTFNFGESNGPVITAIELSGPKGDTGAAGASYTLPTATSTTLGGIELFSDTTQSTAANSVTSTASRTYGLQLNSSSQGVVNVPWTDTTYTAGTGLTLSGTQFSVTSNTYAALSGATFTGDIAVNGGDITTTVTDFKIGNTSTTGSYTTTINPASSVGTQTFNANTNVAGGGGISIVNLGSTSATTSAINLQGDVLVTGTTTTSTIYPTGVVPSANIISSNRSTNGAGVNLAYAGYYMPSTGYGSFIAGQNPLYLLRAGASGTVSIAQFYYTGSAINSGATATASGVINITSGGTPAFASGSDYRMKENLVPVTDAIDRMKLAKAYTFNKIESVDPTMHTQMGFIAHELAEVAPDAVVGEKDAVDEDGNPIYQEVMESRLIPIMAQAISDLIYQNEALIARIEALENK